MGRSKRRTAASPFKYSKTDEVPPVGHKREPRVSADPSSKEVERMTCSILLLP